METDFGHNSRHVDDKQFGLCYVQCFNVVVYT